MWCPGVSWFVCYRSDSLLLKHQWSVRALFYFFGGELLLGLYGNSQLFTLLLFSGH